MVVEVIRYSELLISTMWFPAILRRRHRYSSPFIIPLLSSSLIILWVSIDSFDLDTSFGFGWDHKRAVHAVLHLTYPPSALVFPILQYSRPVIRYMIYWLHHCHVWLPSEGISWLTRRTVMMMRNARNAMWCAFRVMRPSCVITMTVGCW